MAIYSSSSMMPFSRDRSQKYAAALALQLRLPSWKKEMSATQKAKEETAQLALLSPDSLAWARGYFRMFECREKAGTNAWQRAPSSIRERNWYLDKQIKKKKSLAASLCLLCVVLLYCFRNKHSVSIFRANVPTLSSPTKSFYMTNLQVELSR